MIAARKYPMTEKAAIGISTDAYVEFWNRPKPSPDWVNCERNPDSRPLIARFVRRTMTPKVIIDCSMTVMAVPSILGTMIIGCFLHVQ